MKNINHIVAGEELEIPRPKSLGNWKVRGNSGIARKILIPVLAIVTIGGSLALGVGLGNAYDNFNAEKRLREVYTQAIEQYAGINGYGSVDREENIEFYNNILYQNHAEYNQKGLPIKDGKEISVNEFTRWIENYKPIPGMR